MQKQTSAKANKKPNANANPNPNPNLNLNPNPNLPIILLQTVCEGRYLLFVRANRECLKKPTFSYRYFLIPPFSNFPAAPAPHAFCIFLSLRLHSWAYLTLLFCRILLNFRMRCSPDGICSPRSFLSLVCTPGLILPFFFLSYSVEFASG